MIESRGETASSARLSHHLQSKGSRAVDIDLPNLRVLIVFAAEKLDELNFGSGIGSKRGQLGSGDEWKRRWRTGEAGEAENLVSHDVARINKVS